MFKGRRLLIATKHQKERVIAPIMERELGVTCITCATFDSDVLGTFSGEVERKDDALTTVKNKCLLAMSMENCDLAIASEGSFSPHPTIFFAHADEELLILVDLKNKLEIFVRELSLQTNFNAAEVCSVDELHDFAIAAGFPTHGLILKKTKEDHQHLVKGITDWQILTDTYHDLKDNEGKAYVETDMRAMFNPTRMQVIETAAQKLASKVKSACPACQTPGFAVASAKPGLPCELCGLPTQSTLAYTHACVACGFEQEELYPKGKQFEDPTYCNFCNP